MADEDNTTLVGYYTLAQAANYLKCNVHSLHKHVYRSHKLVADINLQGRQLLFTQATLDAFNARWERRRTNGQTKTQGGAQ